MDLLKDLQRCDPSALPHPDEYTTQAYPESCANHADIWQQGGCNLDAPSTEDVDAEVFAAHVSGEEAYFSIDTDDI